jgi:hypothetical protein
VDLRARLAKLKVSAGIADAEAAATLSPSSRSLPFSPSAREEPECEFAAGDFAPGSPAVRGPSLPAAPSPSPSTGGGSGWRSADEWTAAPTLPFADRLTRLRRAKSTALSADREPPEAALARLAGGEYIAPGLLRVERRYPLPHTHGVVPIRFSEDAAIPVPIRRGDTRPFAPERLLMLDTETSGLAGGTGTMAFLVGVARFEGDALVVRQYVVTGFSAEPAMLAAVREWVDAAECLVTFNGKSFDVPLLKTRYALQRERHPFEEIAHADLLHATRRRLRDGWPDCRLKTTEELALGFVRIDDMPGSDVPLAWQRWLRHRDPAPVPRILDHNREDLVSLAALLAVLAGPTAKEAPLLACGCRLRP